MPISLVKAQLIGTLVEGLFYGSSRPLLFLYFSTDLMANDPDAGMYVVVFAQNLRVYYWRHKGGRNTWWLVGISSVIFVLITIASILYFMHFLSVFEALD